MSSVQSKSGVPKRGKPAAERGPERKGNTQVADRKGSKSKQKQSGEPQEKGTLREGTKDLLEDFDEFAENKAREAIGGDVKEFQSAGNTAQAIVISRTPKTEQQILDDCKIDTTVWRVERQKIKQWEVAMAPRAVGRTSDWSRKSADPMVVQLYGYQLWLVRIQPQATEFPEVQPVHFSLKPRKVTRSHSRGGLKTAVVIPDTQHGFRRDHRTGELTPFHDRRALDVAWQICQHVQPDRIVLIGDHLDLPEFSDKFIKSPEFYFCVQPAVVELAWWISRLRSENPSAQIDYISGNHEKRIITSIINHNIASYDLRPADDLDGPALLSVERLLGLGAMGVEYHGEYPSGEVWLNSNLRCHHGDVTRNKSGQTTKVVCEDIRTSEVQGHSHRLELASKTVHSHDGPKTYVAVSAGTLASIQPGVVPSNGSRQNWQNGFLIVQYELDAGEFMDFHPLHIYDGVCLYDYTRWVARPEIDIVEDIEKSLQGKVKIR